MGLVRNARVRAAAGGKAPARRSAVDTRLLSSIALHVFLALSALAFVIPYYWLFTSAFKTLPDIQRIPPDLVPRSPTLANFVELLRTTQYSRSILNSVLVASVTTIGALFFCSLAGYAFAKLRFRGRDLLFLAMLATMMVPTVVVLIPNFVMMSRMGLVDTFWPLLLIPVSNSTSVAPPFGIFWMRQYIGSAIHDELLEAARIDGASEFGIYSRIVVPTIGPGLAGLAIFAFTLSWNSFLQPLVFLRSPQNLTYPVQLVALQSLTWPLRPTNLIMAGGALSVAPMLLLFVLLQRHFIAGLTAGAVKE
jgi:ABC-type glycerol-3-phosphate transport system permease component